MSKPIEFESFMLTLKKISDLHAPATDEHESRVRVMSVAIGSRLGMTRDELEILEWAADVHDWGKIFLNGIIGLATKYNQAQRIYVQQHTIRGFESLEHATIPDEIKLVILHHHEHYDGSGYPHGLKGDAIPIMARIVTVADVWDALISDRPYRMAYTFQKAMREMSKYSDWFDPALFDIWLELVKRHDNQ